MHAVTAGASRPRVSRAARVRRARAGGPRPCRGRTWTGRWPGHGLELGGMSGFTEAIAADVAGEIRLGATVRRVAQQNAAARPAFIASGWQA